MMAVILAGGDSSRLGLDKLLLPVCGRPMIHRVLEPLRAVFDQVLVVGRPRPYLRDLDLAGVVEDSIPGVGPIGGLYTGLQHIPDEHAFFVACDMPFLDPRIMHRQVACALESRLDAVVPRYGPLLEPLHAVYSRRCLPVVSDLIHQGVYRIRRLYDLVNVRYLDIESEALFRRAFCNVNTPEALREIERDAAQFQPAHSAL